MKHCVLRLAIACALCPAMVMAADDDAEVKRCEADLKRLTERTKEISGYPEKLRHEVVALRRRLPGSSISLRAGRLLAQLPSNLDRLDAKTIPVLEKFAWQPKGLMAVLGEHRGRHAGPVSTVAFSPDGQLVASGGGAYLRVWRTTDMRLLQVLSFDNPTALAFSKDGKKLGVASVHGSWALYDVVAGDQPLQARFNAPAGTSVVYGIAFTPNGKKAAMACFDNLIRIFDTTEKTAGEPVQVQGHEKAVQVVAYSPDGKTLASGSADKTVRLWDATLAIPKEKAVLATPTSPITSLAFAPNGATLAVACEDGSIRLWSLPVAARGAREKVVFGDPAKTGPVHHVSFSATGQTLAAACADNTVRLWSVALPKPRERSKLDGHAAAVSSVMYSPDNKMIVTGSADWTCRTWDVSGAVPKERFTPASHLSHVYACAISPDCQTLASGSLDKVLRLWDLNRPDPRTRNYIKGDSIPIYNIAYSPDGSRLAVSGITGTIRQWDSSTGKQLRPVVGLPYYPVTLTYTPDGQNLLTYSDKVAYLYDAETGREIRQFAGHTTPLLSVNLSPDGTKLVTSAGTYLYKDGKIVEINRVPQYTDTTVRLWDVGSGMELNLFKGHKLPVYRAFFAPNGKYVYSGAAGDTSLTRRELASLESAPTQAFPGLNPLYTSYRYSPDGTKLLTLYGASSMKLWDLATWKSIWEGNFSENVAHLEFASDSRHLAVSLATGVIYIIRLVPLEGKPPSP
jgi:WD40 repeat protein